MGTIPYSLEENIPIHDVCMRSFFKNKLKYMGTVVAAHHLQRVCTLVPPHIKVSRFKSLLIARLRSRGKPPHIKVSAWVHWLLSRNIDGYSGCMVQWLHGYSGYMDTVVAWVQLLLHFLQRWVHWLL